MKKVTSLLLALVMALALAVPAFAADEVIQPVGNNGTQDVTAEYTTTPDDTKHTYHVTVTWGTAPKFTYNYQGTEYTWQPGTLSYQETKKTGQEGWKDNKTEESVSLTVENKSDMVVKCSVGTRVDDSQKNGLKLIYTLSHPTNTQAAAAITIESGKTAANYTTENSGKATHCDLSGIIKVEGMPTKGATTLGTITLTLTK